MRALKLEMIPGGREEVQWGMKSSADGTLGEPRGRLELFFGVRFRGFRDPRFQ